jgi:hypothetical protein
LGRGGFESQSGDLDGTLESGSLMSDRMRDPIRTKESIDAELSRVGKVIEVSTIAIATFLPVPFSFSLLPRICFLERQTLINKVPDEPSLQARVVWIIEALPIVR